MALRSKAPSGYWQGRRLDTQRFKQRLRRAVHEASGTQTEWARIRIHFPAVEPALLTGASSSRW